MSKKEKPMRCRSDKDFDTYDFHEDYHKVLDQESKELSYVLQKIADQRVILAALRRINYEGYDASDKVKQFFWHEMRQYTHQINLTDEVRELVDNAAFDNETGKKLLTFLLRWSKKSDFVRKDLVKTNLSAIEYVDKVLQVKDRLMMASCYEKFDLLDEARIKITILSKLSQGYFGVFMDALKGRPTDKMKLPYISSVIKEQEPLIFKILGGEK